MKKWQVLFGIVATAGAVVGLAQLGTAQSGLTDISLALNIANPESPIPSATWDTWTTIKEKTGLNIKFTSLPAAADGDTKLGALAASNDLPDLFEVRNPNLFDRLVQQGQLAPVSSLIPLMPRRNAMRYTDRKRNSLATVNGVQYGFQEPASLSRQYAISIRKDWLEKLDLKAPTTLDEFYEVAKAFTERDPDGNGKKDTYGYGGVIDYDTSGVLPGLGLGNHFQWIYGAYGVAGTWNYKAKSFNANVKDPNYRKATEYIAKLVSNKLIDPDWATMKRADLRTRWQQGRYGMFYESVGGLQSGIRNFDGNNKKAELMFIAPPKGPSGKAVSGIYANAGWLFVVSKKALDAGKGPAIAKFLEFANYNEGYYLLGFGKRGVHYNIVDNIPVANQAVSAAERGMYTQLKWLALNSSPGELKARYAIFTTAEKQATYNFYEMLLDAQNNGWVDRTGDIAIRAASNQADIERYVAENMVQFALGQRPITDGNWDQFLNGLNSLNFEQYENNAEKVLKTGGFLR